MLLNIGDKVCIISMVNPIMYCRAQIIDKINNEKYKVFCVDFGTEELVSLDDIFKLPKELEKVCFSYTLNVVKCRIRGHKYKKLNHSKTT